MCQELKRRFETLVGVWRVAVGGRHRLVAGVVVLGSRLRPIAGFREKPVGKVPRKVEGYSREENSSTKSQRAGLLGCH